MANLSHSFHSFFFLILPILNIACSSKPSQLMLLFISKDSFDHPSTLHLPLPPLGSHLMPAIIDLYHTLPYTIRGFGMSELPKYSVSHLRQILSVKFISSFCRDWAEYILFYLYWPQSFVLTDPIVICTL